MSRVGIDLSPTRCHLIEVQSAGRPPHWPGVTRANDTRVVSFETIPYGWSDPGPLSAALARWLGARRRRRAGPRTAVTVWGLPSAHRLMVLPSAKAPELAALAQREAAADVPLLAQTEVVSGIHAGALRGFSTTAARREVVFAAASAPETRSKIQPLIDAGFAVEVVATPPLALCSIARLQRGTVPGAALALLALGSAASALAIVRDGLLLLARDLPWGYEGFADKEPLVAKLTGELRRSFLFFRQSNRAEITRLALCGDVPDIRALTAPLIMGLDLEVETLDSLDGIDATALPEPADVFRERVASFRLAWAVGSDLEPSINLIPAGIAARRHSIRPAPALIGSLAGALAFGLFGYAYMNLMPNSAGSSSVETGSAAAPLGASPSGPERFAPAPGLPAAAPDSAGIQPSGPLGLPPSVEDAGPAPGPLAAPQVEIPVAAAVADPVVQSILYSAERRAALIDKRIVAVGDQVGIGRIVEIERDAVVVEAPGGERRRLVLRARGR